MTDEQKGDLPTELAAPARRALAEAGYTRLEQFTKVSEAEVARLNGMNPEALDQIRRALAIAGRSFAEGTPEGTQMTSKPRLEVRVEQPCVAIPIQVTLREWGEANALVGEIFVWMAQNGAELAGPPFFRYRVMGGMDDAFDLEVGVPVASPVSGDGRVIASTIPGGRYATVMHTGHPDQQERSHATLQDWAARQGLAWDNRTEGGDEVWGGRYEFYLTDPAEQPDPAQWSIEIAYLVRDDSAG